MATVLVTGGSGFIGSHCILQLLGAGHHGAHHGAQAGARAGRARHAAGRAAPSRASACRSSPPISRATRAGPRPSPAASTCCTWRRRFPPSVPKHEDELIVPARDGALRVLRAARDAGVKRVVLTSSFAAIGYGHTPQTAPFDETSWTNPNGDDVHRVREVEDARRTRGLGFHRDGGRRLELVGRQSGGRVRPGAGPDYSTSILLVQRLMDGAMPGLPEALFRRRRRARRGRPAPARDDRSGRQGRALPRGGRRFHVDARDRQGAARARMGDAAKRVPTRQLPNWLVRLASLRDPAVKQIVPELGKIKNATNDKAQRCSAGRRVRTRRRSWRPRRACCASAS